MRSRAISNHASLFFLLSLSVIFSFDCVKIKAIQRERCFQPSQGYLGNIVSNKTKENICIVEKMFMFPGLFSSNISVNNIEANVQSFSHHTGYYHLKDSHDARIFYYFFESRRNKSDPLILWLTGGPGSGSLVQVFYGNGPFHMNNDLSLKWNNFGWDNIVNMLYVDQPIGAGFSYSSTDRDIRHNTNEVVNDLYDFLQGFFQTHQEFMKNEFYIAGSSYSGHTIPALASRIQAGNKAKEGININLKGLAIENGFIDPVYHHSSLADFALANKLILKSAYKELKRSSVECVKSIQQCQIDDTVCREASTECISYFKYVLSLSNVTNPYDIRVRNRDSLLNKLSRINEFLDLDTVRTALGVGNREYVTLSNKVFDAMMSDFMKNYAVVIPSLLKDGIKVLIVDGAYDMRCNWLGNLRWLESMKWNGHDQFLKTRLASYKIDGKKVAAIKRVGPLTYSKVHDAGHAVNTDQPEVSQDMIKNWIMA